MRRTLPLAATAALAFAACQDTSSPAGPDPAPPSAEAPAASLRSVDVIVTLDPDFAPGGDQANERAAGGIARSLGLQPSHVYGTALFGFAATIPEGRLTALGNDPRVAAVELDQIATIIPRPGAAAPPFANPPGGGGGGGGGGQTTPWGIVRVGGPGDGTGLTACIIDSGIDLDHPDLNVDVGRSVNFASGKSADDGNGHGTHVAGTVAALNNGSGVVGVAAGADLVAIRVLGNSGSGSYSDVIAGVNYAASAQAGCDVANMSLGGPYSQALNDAVQNAAASGVKFALAAGNEDADAATRSPASANGPNIYTVSAIDSTDRFASFSNWGNPPVDYAAPGVSILSTWKGGGTNTISGTSMASPHVAGILLLGNISSDGNAIGDPDGTADRIAHR